LYWYGADTLTPNGDKVDGDFGSKAANYGEKKGTCEVPVVA